MLISQETNQENKKEKERKLSKEKMIPTAFNIAILTVAMLLGATLQAPIPSEDRASMNNTTTVVPGASEQSGGEGDMNDTQVHCPNYIPSKRNKTPNCHTVSGVSGVDHETAFGLQGQNPDWTACGLPRIPQAK